MTSNGFTLRLMTPNVSKLIIIRIVLEALKDPHHIANRVPGIQGLAHKDNFNRAMKIGTSIKPEIFDIIPGNFNFPEDQDAFKAYYS